MSSTAAATHNDHIEAEKKKYFHFINLALFMAAVTGIELAVIFIPFSYWIIMTLVLVLSIVKFIGVIMWFMHLVYDKALCTIIFLTGLLIATGTVVALMFLFSPNKVVPLEDDGVSLAPQVQHVA